MRQLQISQSITNREKKSLEKYFSEIGRQELLTSQEEVLLAQKIRQGEKAALDRLVNANLRFVVSVAKKYQNQGLSLEDLINEGNLGLIKAAQRFDETRGFKFISFAVWWIRQSMLHALGEYKRMVRLPMNHINLLTKVSHHRAALENTLERQPTDEELADFLGVEQQKVWDAFYYSGHTVSYDKPLGSEDGISLIDILAGEFPATDHLVSRSGHGEEVEELLCRLSPDERTVIEYRFGLKGGRRHTNPEIAGLLGCYPEMVRLHGKRALRKLKEVNDTKQACKSSFH